MTDDREFMARIGPVILDSYFVVDQDLKILDFNPAFAQMLDVRGAERRKLVGSHCYDKLRLEICKDKCIALEAAKRNAPVRMEEIRGTTPDGRGVAYAETGNLWVQSLDGGPPRQLTRFTDGRPIMSFAWSRDGKRLAIARTSTTDDIVLIKGLK